MNAPLGETITTPDKSVSSTDREPEARVLAVCDFCGGSTGDPVTGEMTDHTFPDALPPKFRSEAYRFVACSDCGLVYMRERPSAADLDVFYGDGYTCFKSYDERGAVMRNLAKFVTKGKLRQIRERMPAGCNTLLDYGCGSGKWLELIRGVDDSFRMIGMDVTPEPLEALRERGIEAYCCDENGIFDHIERNSVGVIHMFHVIEHLPSAMTVLQRLHEALVPGGVIFGQTPNIASNGCRVWGDMWNQWHVPRHLIMFSDETLRRHAEKAGFEVVKIESSISSATQWAMSTIRWWKQKHKLPFAYTKERFYPPMVLACIPIAVLEKLFSKTCHMDFVLRKPA